MITNGWIIRKYFVFYSVNFCDLCYNAYVNKKGRNINARKYRSFIP